jgi:hypothetical protein
MIRLLYEVQTYCTSIQYSGVEKFIPNLIVVPVGDDAGLPSGLRPTETSLLFAS